MVYLLYGEEDFLLHQELERIRAGLGPRDMLDLNTARLPGAGLTLPEIQAQCDAVPFLAPARLVVVEGLLARFDRLRTPGRGARSARAPRSSGQEGHGTSADSPDLEGGWQGLPEYCQRIPESTHLVLLEGALNRGNPLLALMHPVAETQERRKLRGPALEDWARARAAQLSVRLTAPALRLLVDLVGDNLWVLSSELEKLSLYLAGGTVETHHVEELVSLARETSIFALIDAVAERRLAPAQRSLHLLLRDGMASAQILFRLAGQFRSLVLAKALMEQGVGGPELQSRLGIAAQYPFRKTVEQSRGYPAAALEAVLARLLETDVASKTGKQEPVLALELLVTDLCRGRP
ncbi:MAG: DNA polymerase III subunit delta [Chloroflexi bacterium]|nr:DNA polymerase III subunit delta [Chloroflexota bacterium]